MSKILTFKSNIKCGGCIATVGPFLDRSENIIKWEVNTDVPEKTLRVEVNGLEESDIQQLVKNAGFEVHPIKK